MMATKVGKKGNKTVDVWLDKLGLYRKNIAYDETCLFRAISEQLYNTQIHHEKIRRECVQHARENYEKFVDNIFSTKEDFFDHIERLEKHMVNCGDIELKVISEKYSRCIIIYDAKTNQQIYPFYNKNHTEQFSLCLMDGDHYDVVYQKDHIVTAGFCQSIVYKVLYENVFCIPDVDETVHNMLYDKGNIITQAELMMEKKKTLCESESESISDEKLVEEKLNSSVTVAPFPYKIAKALDPNIYRNIEYDSWSELRREFRLGEWYNGDERLILGTKCIYHDERTNKDYDCYIQEFVKEGDKCMVYLTTTAEKRIVDYCTLSPEDDAKPWPLPFRFKKSVAIYPDASRQPEKNIPRIKKKKEKKRTKSESNISYTATSKPESGLKNVDAYVGVPLQIQNVNTSDESPETSTETQLNSEPLPTDGTATTDVEPGSYWYNNDYQWQPYVQQPASPYLWINNPPNASQNPFNFNLKPMVASAPVTPSIIPYHDPNYFYNHPVESYQAYPQWSTPAFELLPPRNRQENLVKQEATSEEAAISQQDVGRSTQENPESTEFDYRKNKKKLNVSILPTTETPNYDPGRFEMYTPVSPAMQYPQIHPSTPVVFTPVPPPMTEMMMPSSPATFIPSLEMPYMPSSPMVYPLSPPLTTWYPYSGVAPQEFVFPQKP